MEIRKYCPYCGHELTETTAVCPECGWEVKENEIIQRDSE